MLHNISSRFIYEASIFSLVHFFLSSVLMTVNLVFIFVFFCFYFLVFLKNVCSLFFHGPFLFFFWFLLLGVCFFLLVNGG